MLNQQGNNYTPATETLVASVDCDCGAIVPLHESYLDELGQEIVSITTECRDCAQHYTTTVVGRVGGIRSGCSGFYCDCARVRLSVDL
jgi:hypothetical protein